jgi:hypothetical protein
MVAHADIADLLSGVAGALVIGFAPARIPGYAVVIDILYNLDAAVGMSLGGWLLDLSLFTQGAGSADFSLTRRGLNTPHSLLALLALWVGIRQPGAGARLRAAA